MTVEQREQWFADASTKIPGWAVTDDEPFPALFSMED